MKSWAIVLELIMAQKFFLKARLLYQSGVSPTQGAREMTELERTYESDMKSEKRLFEISQLWKRIEPAAREYANGPSIETADRFYAAVYNLPDDWRKGQELRG